MVDPISTFVFLDEQDSGSKRRFSLKKTYNLGTYGGEVTILNKKYLKDLPDRQKVLRKTLDQMAQPVVAKLAGKFSVVKMIWEDSKGDEAKRAWKKLNDGDIEKAEVLLKSKLNQLLARPSSRKEKLGQDKPLRCVYNNLGLISEVAGNLEAAIKYRTLANEAFQNQRGSKRARKAIARINFILKAIDFSEQQVEQWEVKRQNALESMPE